MIRLAIIGFGRRAGHLAKAMLKQHPDVRISAIADPDSQSVRLRLKDISIPEDQIKIFSDVDALLNECALFDAVMIGTRCHLHTPLAVKLAASALPLFLEKPVAISMDQVTELQRAFQGRDEKVVVSFPLRMSPLFGTVHDIVKSGRLGTINQVQAINNVPYGGGYFTSWYRNYDQSGGLWLQKATHDFDAINRLLGSRPISIAAVATQKIYGGSLPFDLRCSQCDRTDECMESPRNIAIRGDAGGMLQHLPPGAEPDHLCAFSEGIENQDSGSAIILYDDGAHATYCQNFVTRRSANRRAITVIGYKATLEFDWYTDEIIVHDHHVGRVDRIKVAPTGGHSGGDGSLLQNFVDVINGEKPSAATLSDGLLSATMCLAARESARTRQFQAIALPWENPPTPQPRTQFVGG